MNLMLGLLVVAFILLAIISMEDAVAQLGYSLEVITGGGNPYNHPNGVVLTVENGVTGATRFQAFQNLPPPSYTFFFNSYEMPAGSPFTVCAVDIDTEQASCQDYTTGFAPTEFVTLNLNPLFFR